MTRVVCIGFLVCLLVLGGHARARDNVEIDGRGLSTGQVEASHALVAATFDRLPPGLRQQLQGKLRLAWRGDLPDDVHGRARGTRIGLRRDLLDDWMQETDVATRDAAVRALLHEIAHVHDRSPRGGLSRDPRLLDLAGWPVRPMRFGQRGGRNGFGDRSPDLYELTSPREFVAVNFEQFLLDPDYACRRPALHRYFSAHFSWSPSQADCAPGLPFLWPDADVQTLGILALDPARVHEVHYLFAEANARPMSRWGHSMLRLVVCAPGRGPGPDCRYDLDHHVVLSFRAFVDDVQISSWRGLTGSYPSRLFVLPLGQVVDEYTKVELRGLQSIPLRLGREEIASLLERAAQVHWSYDGRYYFVSNNCAVETWHLLNAGVERLAQVPLRSITPNGLLRRLQQAGIADASVLADTQQATREGHYFVSQAAHYQSMFEVADAALGLAAAGAGDWMARDPASRSPWLVRGDLRTTAALLLLEQAALLRAEADARETLKRRFLRGQGRDADVDAAAGRLRDLLGDGAYAGRPSLLVTGDGYGLPQAAERAALAGHVVADGERMQSLRSQLKADARALVASAMRHRLETIEDNLVLLGDRLRMLSREEAAAAVP